MTAATPIIDLDGYKARTLLPAADVDVVAGIIWKKVAADALPATPMAEQVFGQVLVDGIIEEVVFRPLAGLASDPTNNATLTINKRTGNAGPVVIAQLTTSGFDWTASVPVVIPIIAGAVAAGDQLTFAITKGGTGVIVPNGTLSAVPSPGWFDFAFARATASMYGRLRKRYAVPFDANNPPEKALDWIVALVDPMAYRKRGVNTSDEQIAEINKARDEALAEMKEAADSDTGLFDLPLLNDEAMSAISQGGPYGYSEFMPYTWTDVQVEDAIENGEITDTANPGFELIS
jgi:hypothetical protein